MFIAFQKCFRVIVNTWSGRCGFSRLNGFGDFEGRPVEAVALIGVRALDPKIHSGGKGLNKERGTGTLLRIQHSFGQRPGEHSCIPSYYSKLHVSFVIDAPL